MSKRHPYPTDVSDEEWHFAAPYLTLMNKDAPQRRYEWREVFNEWQTSLSTAPMHRVVTRIVHETGTAELRAGDRTNVQAILTAHDSGSQS
jgi:hypothetical protein